MSEWRRITIPLIVPTLIVPTLIVATFGSRDFSFDVNHGWLDPIRDVDECCLDVTQLSESLRSIPALFR